MKTRLPDVLKQNLQSYEKEKENSLLSYQSILLQHILNVDKEMLEKLSATYDEAGEMLRKGYQEIGWGWKGRGVYTFHIYGQEDFFKMHLGF